MILQICHPKRNFINLLWACLITFNSANYEEKLPSPLGEELGIRFLEKPNAHFMFK